MKIKTDSGICDGEVDKWIPADIDRSEPEYLTITSNTARNKCKCGNNNAKKTLGGEWLCSDCYVAKLNNMKIRPEILAFAEVMEAETQKRPEINVDKVISMLKRYLTDIILCGDAEVEDANNTNQAKP